MSTEHTDEARGTGLPVITRRDIDRFVATVHMLCLLDNRHVQRISRGLGGALAFHPGEVEAEIGLPWPEPLSLAEEWLDEVPALPWPLP